MRDESDSHWPRIDLNMVLQSVAHPWVGIGSRDIFQNEWLTLRLDRIVSANGKGAMYSVVEKKNYVMVIAENEHSELLCVVQYRYPVKAWVLEFPCGEIWPTETPAEAGARELMEETGYTAAGWRQLGCFYEAASFSTHHAEVLYAKIVSADRHPLMLEPSEEGMAAGWINREELRLLTNKQYIVDGPTLAGLYMLDTLDGTENV